MWRNGVHRSACRGRYDAEPFRLTETFDIEPVFHRRCLVAGFVEPREDIGLLDVLLAEDEDDFRLRRDVLHAEDGGTALRAGRAPSAAFRSVERSISQKPSKRRGLGPRSVGLPGNPHQ